MLAGVLPSLRSVGAMAGDVNLVPIWGRRFRLNRNSNEVRVHLADPHYNHLTSAFAGHYSTCLGPMAMALEWPWLPMDTPLTCFACIQRELETQHMWNHDPSPFP